MWWECDPPTCDLVLIARAQYGQVVYYQGLRTGHVYRFDMPEHKWSYAR